MENLILRTKDVMDKYGVGKPTATRWMKESGLLIGSGKGRKVLMVPAAAFDSYIARGGKKDDVHRQR